MQRFAVKQLYDGVLQGSVLGSLLFLIQVKDVAENTLLTIADDNSLLHASDNLVNIGCKLNQDLQELDMWLLKYKSYKNKNNAL